MTTRLSSANHMVRVSLWLTSGAVVGSDSALDLCTMNRNAALPVRNGEVRNGKAGPRACLVVDCKVSMLHQMLGVVVNRPEMHSHECHPLQ
jgi:hypothetical protein